MTSGLVDMEIEHQQRQEKQRFSLKPFVLPSTWKTNGKGKLYLNTQKQVSSLQFYLLQIIIEEQLR